MSGQILEKVNRAIDRRDFRVALALATSGLHSAQTNGDAEMAAELEFKVGGLLLWIGDSEKAKEHLEIFLSLSDGKDQFRAKRGCALFNLGLIASDRGEYGVALGLLSQVPTFIQNNPRKLGSCLLEQAYASMRAGDLAKGEEILEAARQVIPSDGDNPELLLMCMDGFLHRLRGEYREAAALCERAYAAPKADDHTHFVASWHLGEIALATGDIYKARSWESSMREAYLQNGLPSLGLVLNEFSARLDEQGAAD